MVQSFHSIVISSDKERGLKVIQLIDLKMTTKEVNLRVKYLKTVKHNLHNPFSMLLLDLIATASSRQAFNLLLTQRFNNCEVKIQMIMSIQLIKFSNFLHFFLTFMNGVSRNTETQKGLLVCLYLYSFVCYGRLTKIFVNFCNYLFLQLFVLYNIK